MVRLDGGGCVTACRRREDDVMVVAGIAGLLTARDEGTRRAATVAIVGSQVA